MSQPGSASGLKTSVCFSALSGHVLEAIPNPGFSILGTDLISIQPDSIPPECDLEIDNIVQVALELQVRLHPREIYRPSLPKKIRPKAAMQRWNSLTLERTSAHLSLALC
ncbi:hypothetical protein CONLIGDRAFT_93234 [Coniochaeta ligniaria NRRL 30616]|uniref:Uncharacterized protein n=1 Tax=Coniochaeta ligniaria NRRL 30616 TaxID=1408157 RepID=A0A1J7J8D7_9PEZI|nr:hypothetical protein CONLIGDRAFT_93234 [Coniochaeta ligniaria NRRL 30616]